MSEKRGRGRPKGVRHPNDGQNSMLGYTPDLPVGYNTNLVEFMREVMPTEPLDYTDIDEMRRRFDRYLRLCSKYDMKVGNLAAYAAIGVTKDLVWHWVNTDKGHPERRDFMRQVQQVCSMYREGLMLDGKIYPGTGIFWQKNFDGMKDETEVKLTPGQALAEQLPASEIQKQLEALPED